MILKTDIIEDGSPHYGIGYNTTDRLNLVLSRETKKVWELIITLRYRYERKYFHEKDSHNSNIVLFLF